MNKSDLISCLAKACNLSKKDAVQIVNSIFSVHNNEGIIVRTLLKDEKISISGFGTFYIRKLGCRNLKVPTRANENIFVPASCYVNFKPSKILRNTIKNLK